MIKFFISNKFDFVTLKTKQNNNNKNRIMAKHVKAEINAVMLSMGSLTRL